MAMSDEHNVMTREDSLAGKCPSISSVRVTTDRLRQQATPLGGLRPDIFGDLFS